MGRCSNVNINRDDREQNSSAVSVGLVSQLGVAALQCLATHWDQRDTAGLAVENQPLGPILIMPWWGLCASMIRANPSRGRPWNRPGIDLETMKQLIDPCLACGESPACSVHLHVITSGCEYKATVKIGKSLYSYLVPFSVLSSPDFFLFTDAVILDFSVLNPAH